MNKVLTYRHILWIVFAITSLFSLSGFATVSAQPTQALTESWRSTDFNFNGKMLDTDVAGKAYVLGDNSAANILNIRKYNAAGTLLWQTTYDDPVYNLSGVWIVLDPAQSAVVVANIVRSTDGQPSGWLTLKYDINGNLLWVNPLPRAFSSAVRVSVDSFGNIYVVGTGVLTKYSTSGTTLWQDDTGAVGQPYSMAISIDGNRIAIAGKSGLTGLDFRASMYDANGNRLWTNTSATPYPANDVAFRPNFGYESYFATSTYSPQYSNPYQMAIVKFDAAGNQTYLRNYSVGDNTYRLVATGDGIVATGVDSSGYLDWMTIKTDYAGNLLWSQRFDGAKMNDETPNMLAVATFGGDVYVTGKGGPNPSSGTISGLKGVIVKYKSDGTPQWAAWDIYAGSKALSLDKVDPMGSTAPLTTLGWGYLTTARYAQTGLPDLVPAVPTNLTTSLGFRLNFTDNASNEFWVEIERCTGSGCTNFAKIGQTQGENATAYDDTTTLKGMTYNYRVRALGFMGPSAYSNTVELVIPAANPPAAPSNLTSILSGANIVLNWQDNSTNESQFYIERCQGAGCTNFILEGATLANITTWTHSNAAVAGQIYSYRVRAYNADGYSAYSNIATISTSGGSLLPAAPSNLFAQTVSKSQINLSWANNANNQTGLKIERCKGSTCTNFTQIATLGAASSTYASSGLSASTTYQFRIRAYNAAGDSLYSNIVNSKTLRR
jgi:hypothetical protein